MKHRKIKRIKWRSGPDLFDHTFASGHRVQVNQNGVTIWDTVAGRWVVDASIIANNDNFEVSNELLKRSCNEGPYTEIPGSFKPAKARRAKR